MGNIFILFSNNLKMKFAHILALAAQDEEVVEEEAAAEEEVVEEEVVEEEVVEEEAAEEGPAEETSEGEEAVAAEGNNTLMIVLIVAAVAGLGGVGFCWNQKKLCFAEKSEGGMKQSLI